MICTCARVFFICLPLSLSLSLSLSSRLYGLRRVRLAVLLRTVLGQLVMPTTTSICWCATMPLVLPVTTSTDDPTDLGTPAATVATSTQNVKTISVVSLSLSLSLFLSPSLPLLTHSHLCYCNFFYLVQITLKELVWVLIHTLVSVSPRVVYSATPFRESKARRSTSSATANSR